VLRGRHFAVLAVLIFFFLSQNHTLAHWGYENSANPFLPAVFFRPSLLPCPPGRFIFRWGAYSGVPLLLWDPTSLLLSGLAYIPQLPALVLVRLLGAPPTGAPTQ
jgi:hypothetical protein